MEKNLKVRMTRWLVLLCLTAAVVPVCAQPSAEPLKLTGYVEVTADRIEFTVPDAGFSFMAGDNIPLFQENEDYFIGIISGDDGVKRLAAVRRPIWADPPVWVTKEDRMVFGSGVSSTKGHVEFPQGKKIGISGIADKQYRLLFKSGEHLVQLDVPVKKRGLGEMIPIKGEWPKKPESRVFTMSSKTNVPPEQRLATSDVAVAAAHAGAASEAVTTDLSETSGVSALSRVLQKARDMKEQMSLPEGKKDAPAEEMAEDGEAEEAGEVPAAQDAEWIKTLLACWPYMLSLVFAVALLFLYRAYRKQLAAAGDRPPKPKREKRERKKKEPRPRPPQEEKMKPAPVPEKPVQKPSAPPPAASALSMDTSATLPISRKETTSIPVSREGAEPAIISDFMIGRYQAQTILGRGTTGIVYKAWQEDLKRTVALKVLKEGRHASVDAKLRFLREAQALARLRHPNIIAVYEVGEIDGQPFFSMDFVEGTSLDKVIMAGRPSIREAVSLSRQIASTVQYAHENGIIHRDLKPGNIIVDMKGEPVITDFGLARNLDSGMLSMSGDIIGTPSFMSPEQAQGKTNEVDIRTDVYSIGAVLYSLLTGKSPFARASLLETLNAVINEPPEPIRKLNPQVDRELVAICMRAMAKHKTQRYATAGKMAEALARYLSVPPLQRSWRQARQVLAAAFKRKPPAEHV